MNDYMSKRELRSAIFRLEGALEHEKSMRDIYETGYNKSLTNNVSDKVKHDTERDNLRQDYADLLDGLVFLMEQSGVSENYVKVTASFSRGGEYNPVETVEIEKFLTDVKAVREAASAKEARKRLGIKKGSDNGN